MYRYGDGTPFPFEENFIEIVGAAVGSCAAMFASAAQLDQLRAQARSATHDAELEGAELHALERSIEATVASARPSLAKDASLVQQTAQRALEGARQAIAASRAALERRTAAAAAEPRVDRAMQASFAAAAKFFDRHHLPRTAWSWSWTAAGGASATAIAASFTVTFELTDAPWTGPVRLATLVPGLVAKLPHARLIGKPAPARIHLDKAALTAADRDGDEVTLVFREHAHKSSAGWRVTMDRDAAEAACAMLDEHGQPVGVETQLAGDDAAAMARLVTSVLDAMSPALAARRTREILIGKVALRTLTDPAEPGRALLELLAPTIRTMCQKSRVPGEISLKRDVGDGKREELFVSRALLTGKYASLPPDYRALFDAAGLGRDPTSPDEEELTTDRRVHHRVMPPPPPRAVPSAKTLLAS